MELIETPNEEQFKKHAKKAAISIVIFIISYVIIFSLALALAAGIAMAGFFLIITVPSIYTIILGASLAGAGLFIVFFLFKFLFKMEKIDRSGLTEIDQHSQPELFDVIHRVIDGTESLTPKKVYLTDDVNAMVTYDSNFLSLFLPTKKNLIIGVGLMNSLTVAEFESILAHEFGHFSQNSMKLGSFVYQINRILHNQLFDNDSINSFIQKYGDTGVISLIIAIGVRVIMAIQFILGKLYGFVNKSYMALSREMEFQADFLAANYSGKKPFKSALLRTDLANFSYQDTLQYFNKRISQNIVAKDIYELQEFTLNFVAKKNKIQILNGFPNVKLEHINAYNNSKIIIENQWASHPSTEDRLLNIDSINLEEKIINSEPAIDLLNNKDEILGKVTKKLFKNVSYKGETKAIKLEEYQVEYKKEFELFEVDPYFNNYYKFTDPETKLKKKYEKKKLDLDTFNPFSIENLEQVKKYSALKGDIEILDSIEPKESGIKFFEYDGEKYNRKQIPNLRLKLSEKLTKSEKKVNKINQEILSYCIQKAPFTPHEETFLKALKKYDKIQTDIEVKEKEYHELSDFAQFMSYTLSPEEIEREQSKLLELELHWKKYLRKHQENGYFNLALGTELAKEFDKYLANERPLFNGAVYNDSVVDRFVLILNHIPQLLVSIASFKKKTFIDQMKLILESK